MRLSRRRLAAIVSQAWLLGGGAGTFAAFALAGMLPGHPDGPVFAIFAVLPGLIVSLPVCLVGFAVVLLSPSFAVRWRTTLCTGLPFLIALTGVGIAWPPTSGSLGLTGFATIDAAVASAWCWWRTRGLSSSDPRALARVFE